MYYCISLYDLSIMEIREIILQRKDSRLIAYLYHPRILNSHAFSVQIDFHMRDQGKWYTNLKIHEGIDVNINQETKDRVRELLTSIFVPYFDRLIEEGSLW